MSEIKNRFNTKYVIVPFNWQLNLSENKVYEI